MLDKTILAGCLLWGAMLFLLFCLRPKARLHDMTLETEDVRARGLTFAVFLTTVLVCTLPMGLSPAYNGEEPSFTNQYELLAESMLDGHLYIDYEDIDPKLLEMENPYDYEAREAQDVSYHWDHAFYQGHYYMYFGVVPVFLVFLPYRILTGMSLTTYHATQIFAVLYLCGVFALFRFLAKRFFPQISIGMYLMLSVAFSSVSMWYSVSAPALYCTAISGGICMEIWSLFFFAKAVYGCGKEENEWKSIGYALAGSLFGALAFGCRPPIALANLLVLPLLGEYLRGRKIDRRRIGQLALAAFPYVIVGVLLMVYNYVRFDNPFEFGQSYQLTIVDQSHYGSIWTRLDFAQIGEKMAAYYLSCKPFGDTFPYVVFNGVFVNFPLLGFSIFGLCLGKVRRVMREKRVMPFVLSMFPTALLITFMDILWAPTVLERYRSDIYWLLGILCYVVIGFYHGTLQEEGRRKCSFWISLWGFATIIMCFLLFLVPYDYNYTFHYIEKLEKIRQIIMLRRGVGLL